MGSENDTDLETQPLMADVAITHLSGDQPLDGSAQFPIAAPVEDLSSPLVDDTASESTGEADNGKPEVSSTDWLKMGGMLWVVLMLSVGLFVVVLQTVAITVEITFFLVIMASVPISMGYMFLFYSRLDRNQYPQFTELPIWRLIENDKICYSVLAFCLFISLVDASFDFRFEHDMFFTLCSFCKGAVLLLFGSRKAYLLLVRWKTMKAGQTKNLEMGKIILVAVPVIYDWTFGVIIYYLLMLSFLAAVIEFFLWSRTQNMKEVYSHHKRQATTAFQEAKGSGVIRKGRNFLASTLRAAASAAAESSAPPTSAEVIEISSPASSGQSNVV